jgi:hypothetical protein
VTFARTLLATLLLCEAVTAIAGRPGEIVAVSEDDTPTPLALEAFRAAFGRASPALVSRDGNEFDFSPLMTVEMEGGMIALLSTGAMRNAGHSSSGVNAVHYFTREVGRLRAVREWFGVGAEGSHGVAASVWGLSRSISRWPVIYTEGGGTWQGCTVTFATLTELRPTGPVDVAHIPVYFSDSGMVSEGAAREVEGALSEAIPDRSFTVDYSGSLRFREIYVRQDENYRLASGESRMPGC